MERACQAQQQVASVSGLVHPKATWAYVRVDAVAYSYRIGKLLSIMLGISCSRIRVFA